MSKAEPRTSSAAPPIVALVQYAGQTDHFAGVDAAASARSVRVVRINEWELADLDRLGATLVAVKDCESPLAAAALRWARRRGVATLLLMDGVVEYRNTFVNPDVPERYLRPAPVDAVACAGEIDRARLWSWGNVAVATGLPRICAAFPKPLPIKDLQISGLLIATARRPAFDAAERRRLAAALRDVRAAAQEAGWGDRLMWRLTAGLDEELGVANDTRPLRECLADCRGVLTTPSTLLLEAMAAGRACGVLHPQDGPLWQEAMGEWRGADVSPRQDLVALLRRMAAPDEADWRRQRRAMERMHAEGQPAARVAEMMVSMLRGELRGGPGRKRELPRIARVRLGAGAAEALYGLGAALARREEELSLANRGLAYLQLGLYLDPDHPLALLSLADLYEAMKKPEISLKVALGLGKGADRVLTCDLTKEYVAINGDYRS